MSVITKKPSRYESIKKAVLDTDNQHNLGLFIQCAVGALAAQAAMGTALVTALHNKASARDKAEVALFLTAYSDLLMLPPALVAKNIYDKNVKKKK